MPSTFTMHELLNLDQQELARRLMICERVRKHWRIIAIKAVLGTIQLDGLQLVCLHEQMGSVPDDEYLDKEFQEVLAMVDARYSDDDAGHFKELRRITLDGQSGE